MRKYILEWFKNILFSSLHDSTHPSHRLSMLENVLNRLISIILSKNNIAIKKRLEFKL